MIRYCEGYVGEGALAEREEWILPPPAPNATWWYRSYFFKKFHSNFFATESPLGKVAISVCFNDQTHSFYVIFRSAEGIETFEIASKDVPTPKQSFLSVFKKKSSFERRVISTIKPDLKTAKLFQHNSDQVQQQLLSIESPDVFNGKYRIGLVYAKFHQNNESDMFCNMDSSPEFREFLELIGDLVELRNWGKYSGGLDISNGSSGPQALYTAWHGSEIVWHVPTLMPYFAGDDQQLERKKHVGNDRAVVVFRDPGGEPLAANLFSSKAIHLFFLVEPHFDESDPQTMYYKLAVASKQSVPNFGPPIPETAVFKQGPEFRDFLIGKLINGIQSTSHADEFKPLMTLKYMQQLTTVCTQFACEQKKEAPESGSYSSP